MERKKVSVGKKVSDTFFVYNTFMGRALRVDVGNEIFHVINRANGRATIFQTDYDYKSFEHLLEEAKEKFSMRVLVYEIMPNHWHLLLYPKNNGDLSSFMQWLTLTHTQRWHAFHNTAGNGHLYQGRYKSFIVQKDNYFLSVARYIERNALRAGLVKNAKDWKWSSLWRRKSGTDRQKGLLSPWPVEMPHDYTEWVNKSQDEDEVKSIRESVNRGKPFGNISWVEKTINKFGLGSTLRPKGRPKKGV